MSSLLERIWHALLAAGSRGKVSVEDCIRAGRKDRKLNEREKNVMRVALKKFQGGGLELKNFVASRVASTG